MMCYSYVPALKSNQKKIRCLGCYTRGITPKRVASGRGYLRRLASEQHSSEETSQRCRTVDHTVPDLADLGFEPKIYRTDSNVLTVEQTGCLCSSFTHC